MEYNTDNESKEIKACPACGEEILEVAIKCKHCSSFISGDEILEEYSKKRDYGIALLVIPIISSFFIWFWIGAMTVHERPDYKLLILEITTILTTAIIASLEVSKNGDITTGFFKTPVGWFFGISLLWIIYYPVYMYKRAEIGLDRYLLKSLFVVFVYAYSSYSIAEYIIEEHKKYNNKVNIFYEQIEKYNGKGI